MGKALPLHAVTAVALGSAAAWAGCVAVTGCALAPPDRPLTAAAPDAELPAIGLGARLADEVVDPPVPDGAVGGRSPPPHATSVYPKTKATRIDGVELLRQLTPIF